MEFGHSIRKTIQPVKMLLQQFSQSLSGFLKLKIDVINVSLCVCDVYRTVTLDAICLTAALPACVRSVVTLVIHLSIW